MLGLYPPLFVTLLLRVSCTVGVQLPKNLQSRERRSSSSHGLAPRSLHPCRYGGAGALGGRRAGNAPACRVELISVCTNTAACAAPEGWAITAGP